MSGFACTRWRRLSAPKSLNRVRGRKVEIKEGKGQGRRGKRKRKD